MNSFLRSSSLEGSLLKKCLGDVELLENVLSDFLGKSITVVQLKVIKEGRLLWCSIQYSYNEKHYYCTFGYNKDNCSYNIKDKSIESFVQKNKGVIYNILHHYLNLQGVIYKLCNENTAYWLQVKDTDRKYLCINCMKDGNVCIRPKSVVSTEDIPKFV